MSDHIIFGIHTGASRVPVKGPAADGFELASALYMLLQQASASGDLAGGGLKGAVIGEPRLQQGMSFQTENLSVTIGGQHFRIAIMAEPA